jgi:asparagine N-glycosylation enzyme membrane subunit Stt3
MDEITKRDESLLSFFKSKYLIYVALAILLVIGAYIRYLPLTDHNGIPGLWDITTNDYTLGPDLDPFLFLRYATMLDTDGSIPTIDMMRYYPSGYDTRGEALLVPWLIYLTHNAINTVSSTFYSINYAAALLPVIMFGFTILFFFLFVKEIFYRKQKQNHLYSGIIAIISTIFLIIVPSFLGRTVAGIPEKESVGFFLMFLAAWLFLKSWKEDDNQIKCYLYSILAGISTGLMGLAWGGVIYLFVSIPVASMLAFIINKFKRVNYIGFALWLASSLIVMLSFSDKFNIKQFLFSIGLSLGTILLFVFMIHILCQKLKIYAWFKNKYPTSIVRHVPENILSIVISFILMIIGASILVGPSFLVNTVLDISRVLFNPTAGGRWVTTVAENQQPYFVQWSANFGTYVLYLFLISSVFFIRKVFNMLTEKENMILTGSYIFLLIGIIYSRYSPAALLNGENFISKALYLSSVIVFMVVIVYHYIKYNKNKINIFEKIDFSDLFLTILFIVTLFTARSAVRLIMVLAIIAPIFIAYIIAELIQKVKESKDSTNKLFTAIILITTLILTGFSGYQYYNITKTQAYNYVPYYYTYQWQQAMDWVRDSTPTTSVFAHWWDYGYWVQSIGHRATITDGGNSNIYWNYLMGRNILTGDNQKDSLEFLYTHNATHLLIDSSDIGKYGAFSQIGSDAVLDRFSNGPAIMATDPKTLKETRNGTVEIYQGTSYLDEDISFNGTYIFKENGAVLGVVMEKNNGEYIQPQAIFYNRGSQVMVPLRYVYYNKTLTDFGSGINATAYPIQQLAQVGIGMSINPTGGLIYLSPRIMRGFLGQVYILNDPLNNFPAFKLNHSQPDFILQQVAAQGIKVDEFVEYGGIRGPIKIWSINYNGDEILNPKYLNTTFPPEITWKF